MDLGGLRGIIHTTSHRGNNVTATRDPVSVMFDAGARKLLERAYARPGLWVSTRVTDPTPRHFAALAAYGIDPLGPDPVAAQLPGRGINARSRWVRGFIRSLYYQHRYYSGRPGGGWRPERRSAPRSAVALEVQVGRRMPAGKRAAAGRIVRVRVHRGAAAARHAAEREPTARRIYERDGEPGMRHAEIELGRDWE